jgi:hypothetical protein
MNEALTKKTGYLFFAVIGSLLISVLFFSCMYQTPPSPEFVSPRIHIKGRPAGVTSIDLEVSGADIETIEESIDVGDEEITVEVPAGSDRTFTLTMQNPSVTFSGEVKEDLTAGEELDITIPLEFESSRIIIPDPDANRMVQVDTFTGGGWIDREGSDYGIDLNLFQPYDVDFDNQGRLYIANNDSDEDNQVFRIDHIGDTSVETIVNLGEASNIKVLALDRNNNYLYYTDGWGTFYRKILGPPVGTQISFDIFDEPGVISFQSKGIAVNSNGNLIIPNYQQDEVYEYDPSRSAGDRIVTTSSVSFMSSPTDVRLIDNGVVILNGAGIDGYRILVLDENLALIDHFGNYGADEFYFPLLFVAVLNKKLSILDTDFVTGDEVNRLVSCGSDGGPFTIYMAGDDGQSPFQFYNIC